MNLPILLAGSTASGKSDVAMALAGTVNGEIISVDSMQVYRGLDIGTAKPSSTDRERVRHHLIDILDLGQSFDAARFVELANSAIADIQQRGKVPVLCGGTGLYLKAWLHGLGDAPPSDPELRATLEETPLEVLLAELERGDPQRFASIDRQNPRRVVRAVEILRLTGKPTSAARADWNLTRRQVAGSGVFVLRREQEDLTRRINGRVDRMFAAGFVEETRELMTRGLADNATAMQAIGYRQIESHLRGEMALPETIELVKCRTRQFARRQITWLKHQLPCEWLNVGSEDSPGTTARRMFDLIQSKTS